MKVTDHLAGATAVESVPGVPSVHVSVMQDTRPFVESMRLLRGTI